MLSGLGRRPQRLRCWLRCLLSLPALLISYFETWHFHTLANLKAYKMVANTRTSCYRHPCCSCCSCCCCCCLISWRMCFVATAGGTLVVVAVALLHAETHERRILFAHMQQGSAAATRQRLVKLSPDTSLMWSAAELPRLQHWPVASLSSRESVTLLL